MSGLFASIDIGTNSAKLLIAERRDGSLAPVLQKAAVPRVGRNLAATGRISDASFHDLAIALESFLEEIARLDARLVGAVATQAFRIAANGPELLARISDLLGCETRIIAGQEESRLGYLAVSDRHPPSGTGALAVLDIGGGSTEATRASGGISVPIGAVNLLEAERSGGAPLKPGSDAAAYRMRAAEAFRGRFADWSGTELVAVGGTATALAMLELELGAFDAAAIEGLRIARARVTAAIDFLSGLAPEAKAALPGLDKDRADILLPGLCILEAFLDAVGAASFRISDRGIRYGVILDAIAQDGKGNPA